VESDVLSDVSYLSDISEPDLPVLSLPSEPSEPSLPEKRRYTKSGKYSKKKQPSLTPVFIGEEEDIFYPKKPPPELSARFGEPNKYAISRPQAELPESFF
jgi:hypothetical protein